MKRGSFCDYVSSDRNNATYCASISSSATLVKSATSRHEQPTCLVKGPSYHRCSAAGGIPAGGNNQKIMPPSAAAPFKAGWCWEEDLHGPTVKRLQIFKRKESQLLQLNCINKLL